MISTIVAINLHRGDLRAGTISALLIRGWAKQTPLRYAGLLWVGLKRWWNASSFGAEMAVVPSRREIGHWRFINQGCGVGGAFHINPQGRQQTRFNTSFSVIRIAPHASTFYSITHDSTKLINRYMVVRISQILCCWCGLAKVKDELKEQISMQS